MEKCGCSNCTLILGIKAIDKTGYDVENCPCQNCLVKVLCDKICNDMLEHVKAYNLRR